jgi:hypothetical protein
VGDIRIVRLQNGEDVMAIFKEEEGTGEVFLGSPMTMFFKRLPSGKAMMMMSPWLPLELVENNHAHVFVSDILTVLEPKKALINYYIKIVNETEYDAIQASKEIEDSLDGDHEEMSLDHDLEEDGELMDEFESLTNGSKKHILH